ncbi:MAG TPA: Gfo/Idh/MocA family oxidoreductase [Acetobacteraceae bacterium]|nr:Gfo/Idh/MocA family oxidoreductase [Acetobacteraceae bacterium]
MKGAAIRAAIVGLGWWGRNLVDAVRHSEAIRFTTAHTRTAGTVADYCRERELRWIDNLDMILCDSAIDAVVFATPHSLHAEQIRRAAIAGKAVFVEKPFTLSVSDAKAAVDAAEKAGVVLAVGFNRRFHPSMGMLREAVKEQHLGTIVTISAEQTELHGLALTPDAWRAQPDESPGGAMTAIGVHLVDGMIDLMGRVDTVYCRISRHAARYSDDTTDILLTFENGATGHIFCSVTAAPNYRMAVYGAKGFAEVLGHPMQTFRLIPALDGEHRGTGAPQVTETAGFNMLTAELEAFAASIGNRHPFPTPLTEILHGVAVFEAVLRSAASGQTEPVG